MWGKIRLLKIAFILNHRRIFKLIQILRLSRRIPETCEFIYILINLGVEKLPLINVHTVRRLRLAFIRVDLPELARNWLQKLFLLRLIPQINRPVENRVNIGLHLELVLDEFILLKNFIAALGPLIIVRLLVLNVGKIMILRVFAVMQLFLLRERKQLFLEGFERDENNGDIVHALPVDREAHQILDDFGAELVHALTAVSLAVRGVSYELDDLLVLQLVVHAVAWG